MAKKKVAVIVLTQEEAHMLDWCLLSDSNSSEDDSFIRMCGDVRGQIAEQREALGWKKR